LFRAERYGWLDCPVDEAKEYEADQNGDKIGDQNRNDDRRKVGLQRPTTQGLRLSP